MSFNPWLFDSHRNFHWTSTLAILNINTFHTLWHVNSYKIVVPSSNGAMGTVPDAKEGFFVGLLAISVYAQLCHGYSSHRFGSRTFQRFFWEHLFFSRPLTRRDAFKIWGARFSIRQTHEARKWLDHWIDPKRLHWCEPWAYCDT